MLLFTASLPGTKRPCLIVSWHKRTFNSWVLSRSFIVPEANYLWYVSVTCSVKPRCSTYRNSCTFILLNAMCALLPKLCSQLYKLGNPIICINCDTWLCRSGCLNTFQFVYCFPPNPLLHHCQTQICCWAPTATPLISVCVMRTYLFTFKFLITATMQYSEINA